MTSPRTTGLYIHMPFCRRRCAYCDFDAVVGMASRIPEYVDAVIREVDFLSTATGNPELESVYFGGGTPTCASEGVVRLLDAVRTAFPVAPAAEITVEANPESAGDETLMRLAAAGVNRLSLGVQSFDDERLTRLGRLHDSACARDAVQRARSLFPEVNLDLIFGLPGTPVDAWQRDLEGAVALDVDHVSAYCLTVEAGTPLAEAVRRGKAPPPDEDLEAAHLDLTSSFLSAHGYERYEISNHARAGRRCRHNLMYWENRPCLGAGLGAAAFWEGTRWKNETSFQGYLRSVAGRKERAFPPGPAASFSEHLNPEAALGESILVGLRLLRGVDLEALGARHGVNAHAVFGRDIRRLLEDGHLKQRASRLALTPSGLRFADRILAAFTLPGDRQQERIRG